MWFLINFRILNDFLPGSEMAKEPIKEPNGISGTDVI